MVGDEPSAILTEPDELRMASMGWPSLSQGYSPAKKMVWSSGGFVLSFWRSSRVISVP